MAAGAGDGVAALAAQDAGLLGALDQSEVSVRVLQSAPTLTTGVCVMSWSTNCPHCISISVYFSFSRDWELMVAVDTERGEGRPSDLGASTPSSYYGMVIIDVNTTSRLIPKVPSEFCPKVCNHGEGPY